MNLALKISSSRGDLQLRCTANAEGVALCVSTLQRGRVQRTPPERTRIDP